MAEEGNGFEVNQHVPVLDVGPELDAHIQRALNIGQGAGNGGVPPPGGNGPAGGGIAQAEAEVEAVAAPIRPPGNEPLQGGRKRGRKSRRKSRKSRKSRRRRRN